MDSFGCPYEYRNYGGDDAFSKAAALMGPFARVVATLHEDARNNQSWVEGAGWINLRDDIEAQIWFKDSTSAGDSALEVGGVVFLVLATGGLWCLPAAAWAQESSDLCLQMMEGVV